MADEFIAELFIRELVVAARDELVIELETPARDELFIELVDAAREELFIELLFVEVEELLPAELDELLEEGGQLIASMRHVPLADWRSVTATGTTRVPKR